MKKAKQQNVWLGLVGGGMSAVFGMPPGFDLQSSLSHASHIRLATAFAHESGWSLISDSIAACKGQTDVLAGLDFFQTEPKLLREWLKISYESDKFKCKVVTKTQAFTRTFHPKVLIVSGPKEQVFAVVGSGNLSAGGFRDNVECGLFTDNSVMVSELSKWFDKVYESLAVELDEAIISRYEPLHKKYRTRSKKLVQQESVDLSGIDKEVEAKLGRRSKAVSDAKAFFQSSEFLEKWEEHRDAILRIQETLHYPKFDFNCDGLEEFLKIKQFGNTATLLFHKKQLCRDVNRGKVRESFKVLTDDSQPERLRLNEVFSGANKVEFIGRNVITKVLAAHDGKRWPVYNTKVVKVLKEQYGYWIPRGLTEADKYLAYAKLMREFAADSGASDVYALDRFILHRSKQS
jgi:HKD family nuclease